MERTPGNHWDFDNQQATRAVGDLFSSFSGFGSVLVESAAQSREFERIKGQFAELQAKAQQSFIEEDRENSEFACSILRFATVTFWSKINGVFPDDELLNDISSHLYRLFLEKYPTSKETQFESVKLINSKMPGFIKQTVEKFFSSMNFTNVPEGNDPIDFMINGDHIGIWNSSEKDIYLESYDYERATGLMTTKNFFFVVLTPEQVSKLGPKLIGKITPKSFFITNPELIEAFTEQQIKYFNKDQLMFLYNIRDSISKKCPIGRFLNKNHQKQFAHVATQQGVLSYFLKKEVNNDENAKAVYKHLKGTPFDPFLTEKESAIARAQLANERREILSQYEIGCCTECCLESSCLII